MSDDDRKRQLERIEKMAEKFENVSKRYWNLYWLAKESKNDVFFDLVEAMGVMVDGSLEQTGTLLDILRRCGDKTKGPDDE